MSDAVAEAADSFEVPELDSFELGLLEALRGHGMAPTSYIRHLGSAAKLSRALIKLEDKGRAQRVFNAHGPQTPWWWQALPDTPPAHDPIPEPAAGEIYDWGQRENRVWLEVLGSRNAYGLLLVSVRAGEHPHVKIHMPLWILARQCCRRSRGEVTSWSSQFFCPVHGECTLEMVKTDKTCALCGSLLNRS